MRAPRPSASTWLGLAGAVLILLAAGVVLYDQGAAWWHLRQQQVVEPPREDLPARLELPPTRAVPAPTRPAGS